jgi:hypothetical protein
MKYEGRESLLLHTGLMATAGLVHYVMNALHITIDIRNVCVLIGPFFASNTAIVAYPARSHPPLLSQPLLPHRFEGPVI